MECIGFIGLGLIGGSLARAIRKFHPEIRLTAYSHTRVTLDEALSEGVIDEAWGQNDPRFSECDLIFLCAPVQTNISYLPFLKKAVKSSCLISDVGSVKGEMQEAAEKAGLSRQFIGGHPMAGSEKTGFSSSRAYILENAWYFLTTTEKNAPEDIRKIRQLVTDIHALPLVLNPEEHDFLVAGVSHLPHLVASGLVNTIKNLDDPEERMKLVAAGGFRDITRIASSSPVMWEQICLSNRDCILKVLDSYLDFMQHARELVAAGDGKALNEMFTSSRNYRDSMDDTRKGSVTRQFLLYVDILDEPGGIATITTLLAMNQISIKNIGVIHNREFEEGVLRIEYYDEESRNRSAEILRKRNYIIRKTM